MKGSRATRATGSKDTKASLATRAATEHLSRLH
jgi:hypothetical protein